MLNPFSMPYVYERFRKLVVVLSKKGPVYQRTIEESFDRERNVKYVHDINFYEFGEAGSNDAVKIALERSSGRGRWIGPHDLRSKIKSSLLEDYYMELSLFRSNLPVTDESEIKSVIKDTTGIEFETLKSKDGSVRFITEVGDYSSYDEKERIFAHIYKQPDEKSISEAKEKLNAPDGI